MQTTTIWFTKSRRAQSDTDYETWVEGGVSPTLNIFDNNGDTRATVLILMRWREGKPGGGKGALLSKNKSLTLATANDQVLFCYSIREDATANNFSATPIETTPALQALRPSVQSHHAQTFIAQEIPVNETIGFQPTDGGFTNYNDDGMSTTLKASDAPAVAYDECNEPLAIDGYNQTFNKTMQTIRADKSDGDHVGMVMNETVVRRLTPIECERLQGFPDNWAAQRIDHKTGNVIEQKDSARYKQMGNAVAVPCVQWLLARIIAQR